jgi:hypothetical protein
MPGEGERTHRAVLVGLIRLLRDGYLGRCSAESLALKLSGDSHRVQVRSNHTGEVITPPELAEQLSRCPRRINAPLPAAAFVLERVMGHREGKRNVGKSCDCNRRGIRVRNFGAVSPGNQSVNYKGQTFNLAGSGRLVGTYRIGRSAAVFVAAHLCGDIGAAIRLKPAPQTSLPAFWLRTGCSLCNLVTFRRC